MFIDSLVLSSWLLNSKNLVKFKYQIIFEGVYRISHVTFVICSYNVLLSDMYLKCEYNIIGMASKENFTRPANGRVC